MKYTHFHILAIDLILFQWYLLLDKRGCHKMLYCCFPNSLPCFIERRVICFCGFKHQHSIMVSTSAIEGHKKGSTSNFLINIISPWQIQMAPWTNTFILFSIPILSVCTNQIPFSFMTISSEGIPFTDSFKGPFLPFMPLK